MCGLHGCGLDDPPLPAAAPPGPFFNTWSFLFSGSNQYIGFGAAQSLDILQGAPKTISFWIKSPTGQDQILRKQDSVLGPGWRIFMADNNAQFRADLQDDIGNRLRAQTPNPQDGNWHNVILVYRGDLTGMDLYVDGVPGTQPEVGPLVGTTDTGFTMFAGWKTIGSDLNGILDEISLWDANFSPAEINELYNGGVSTDLAQHSRAADLIHWWRMGDDPMDDGTGGTGTIRDQAGTSHGTPQGTTPANIVADAP